MRRQEALTAVLYAAIAGLFVTPLVLLVVEIAIDHVRFAETFGGALFAVAFFCSTSITVAFYQDRVSLAQAVLTSYVIKSAVVFLAATAVSFDRFDRSVVASSIAFTSFAYLIVQTVYIAGRKGRVQRRINRLPARH